MCKDSHSNSKNHSEMRTCSSGRTQPLVTPLKPLSGKMPGDVIELKLGLQTCKSAFSKFQPFG